MWGLGGLALSRIYRVYLGSVGLQGHVSEFHRSLAFLCAFGTVLSQFLQGDPWIPKGPFGLNVVPV